MTVGVSVLSPLDMPWRFPQSFLEHYPPPAGIALAAHRTMDPSVPPIAHHTPDLQAQAGGDPYSPMPNITAQWDRLSYYGSVSWTDSQIGRVLDAIDVAKVTPDTLIVLHSDHVRSSTASTIHPVLLI